MQKHHHNRRSFLWSFAATSALGLTRNSAWAFQQPLGNESVADQIHSLKPGQYLWAPKIAPAGPVLAIVSLPAQRLYLYRNGILIGVTTVSTGKQGHSTPKGVFTILQKQVHHKSSIYNSAPMPYMQRLTWYGIAMHAGNLPGYPASHGCVRMPLAFSKLLYSVTSLGMTVVITDTDQVPRVAPTPDVLESNANIEEVATGHWTWNPEAAPTGPVSLILSAADRRLLVMRNGVIIGSTPVTLRGSIDATRAFSLAKMDESGFHWLELPLPGDDAKMKHEMTAEERSRVKLPNDFRAQLDSILTPGITLVVTTDSLKASETGTKLTVMKAGA